MCRDLGVWITCHLAEPGVRFKNLCPAMSVPVSDNFFLSCGSKISEEMGPRQSSSFLSWKNVQIHMATRDVRVFLRHDPAGTKQRCPFGQDGFISDHVIEIIGNQQKFCSGWIAESANCSRQKQRTPEA